MWLYNVYIDQIHILEANIILFCQIKANALVIINIVKHSFRITNRDMFFNNFLVWLKSYFYLLFIRLDSVNRALKIFEEQTLIWNVLISSLKFGLWLYF